MDCKNMKLRPKDKLMRKIVGHVDSCEHIKKMDGINISLSMDKCPLSKLCKYFVPVDR